MKTSVLRNGLKRSFIVLLTMIISSLFLFSFNPKHVYAEIIDNQCNGDHTGWTPLTNDGGNLPTGNYYLAEDITLLSNIVISSGTVNLDLNGNILTGAIGSDESIFRVTGGTLNIYDCNSENKVHSYKIKEVIPNLSQDIYINNPNYSNKLFQKYYDFTDVGDGVIVGGIITGGHKYATKTDLKNNFYYPGGGSAILVGEEGVGESQGTVNIYGGTLSGNTVTALSQWGGKRERSGTIAVIDGGTLNFYDGQIVGNSSRYPGAGILVFGSYPNSGHVNIFGGIIKENYSLESVYNFGPASTFGIGGAAVYTENISSQSSIVSISGSPQIVDNYHYNYSTNNYMKTNMSYSLESLNAINIAGLLYTEENSVRTYAKIGLYGGAANKLTSGYTTSGNTHADVNKIFFADNQTQAVAYNVDNVELKYVTSNLYTLTYNSNSGVASTTETVSVVDKISVSQSLFQRTGYYFVNWNTKADGTGIKYLPDDIITLTANQTLYAIWNPSSYRINFWTNGGSLEPGVVSHYTYGSTTTLSIPTWSGKTFEGWYDNSMLSGTPVTVISSTAYGDKIYYAKWSGVTQYIITSIAGANGSISPLGSIIYDGISQDYVISPDSGYKISTFTVAGIDRKADIVNNVYTVTGITADTAINVSFEKILSTDITVYSANGANGTITPKGYTIVSSGSDLTYTITPNPGYRVKSVLVNGTNVGAVSTYTLNGITRSQSVQVEFELASSALTLHYNGGSYTGTKPIPTEYLEGVGYTLPTAVEMNNSNYTFGGWYDNVSLSGSAVTSVTTSDTGAKTFYAKWNINQFTATFKDYDGTTISTSTVDYLTSAVAPDNPTRTGYTFAGWDVSYSSMTANIIITATYTINTYTATFVNWDGSFLGHHTVNYLQTAYAPPITPTRTGYTFAGWDKTTTSMTENVTVTATYTINQYTISFNSNSGSAVASITQNYNSDVTAPADPSRANHTFGGWYSDYLLSTVYDFDTMPAENVTVYAKWTEKHITGISADNIEIIYDGNDHSIVVEGLVAGDVIFFKTTNDYSVTNPVFNDVTEFVTVYYKVQRSDYFDYEGYALVKVSAASLSVISITGYNGTYDGDEHEAVVNQYVTSINHESLTWKYKVGADEEYSDTIPSFMNVGNYTVYYQITAPNHHDYQGSFTVTVSPKNIQGAVITLGKGINYNGSVQTQLVSSVTVDGLEVTYDITGNTGTNHNPDGYTIVISGNGNFTGNAEIDWNIGKASYDMSQITFNDLTIKEDGTPKNITVNGTLPNGVTVSYQNNDKTEAGIYSVTAVFTGDEVNYEPIANMNAILTILFSHLSVKADDNSTENPDIVIESEAGIETDLSLIISIVPSENVNLELTEKDEIVRVYRVNLMRGEESVALTETCTIRLLIPAEIKEKVFSIYHNETKIDYTVENEYAVLTVSHLSDFAFVVENEEVAGSLVWLITVLSVLVLGEAVMAALKIIQNKKNNNQVKLSSYSPLLFVLFIPTGQITFVIILAVIFLVLGLLNLYLYLPNKNAVAENQNEEAVKKTKQNEVVEEVIETVKLEKITPIQSETSETEVTEEEEEEKTVFKGFEEETGLAILIRYKKSFLARLIQSGDETKYYYSVLKNTLLSYKKVSSHISWSYDSINAGRLKLAKFNVRGKNLYVYLALNPDDYQGTKYHVEKVESKRYADLPCLYKIKNSRRAKYAMELMGVLAKKNELVYGEYKSDNYVIPYETTEALIEKELIKELVSKDKYLDWLNSRETKKGFGNKRSVISAHEVDGLLNDDEATSMIQKISGVNYEKKEKAIINIDTISDKFSEGDTVNLKSLKEKGLLADKINHYKILSRGKLDKALIMEANDFSLGAVKMILITGGKVIEVIEP